MNDQQTASPKYPEKEIWREVPGDYYSPYMFATGDNKGIGIAVGGSVYVKTAREWHRLASHGYDEIDHGFRIRQIEMATKAWHDFKLRLVETYGGPTHYLDRVIQDVDAALGVKP